MFLFIHGTASSGRIWSKTLSEMPWMDSLGRPLTPDLPGMGELASASGLSTLTFEDWVGYLKGIVVARSKDRVHVIGHSLGGALATAIAGEEWVASVALISPATAAFCRDMRRATRPGARPGSIRLRRVLGSLVHDPTSLTREDAVMLREDYERAGPLLEGGLPWPDSSVEEAFLLAGKRMLVVWGEEDNVVAPEYHLKLCERLRASGVPVSSVPIANCGHVPMLEYPRELARILLDHWAADSRR